MQEGFAETQENAGRMILDPVAQQVQVDVDGKKMSLEDFMANPPAKADPKKPNYNTAQGRATFNGKPEIQKTGNNTYEVNIKGHKYIVNNSVEYQMVSGNNGDYSTKAFATKDNNLKTIMAQIKFEWPNAQI